MMIYDDVGWCSMTHDYVCGSVMMCDGVWWCMLLYDGAWRCIM